MPVTRLNNANSTVSAKLHRSQTAWQLCQGTTPHPTMTHKLSHLTSGRRCSGQTQPANTAALGREQTEEELKGTTATPEDRQRMLQVLQRMQDLGSPSSSDSDDSSETGLAEDAEQLLRSLEVQVSLHGKASPVGSPCGL